MHLPSVQYVITAFWDVLAYANSKELSIETTIVV
jgi:hypothetical protein